MMASAPRERGRPDAVELQTFHDVADGPFSLRYMQMVDGQEEDLKTQTFFLLRACATLGLSGFIMGYDIGVISGALPLMRKRFDLGPLEEGLVVSFLAMGSTLGSFVGGLICDRIGRKRTVHLQNLHFAVGTVLICSAQHILAVYAGRIIVGMGAALSAVASLSYLCEIAPSQQRGLITSAYEMLIVIGILVAWSTDFVASSVPEGWRLMFGAILVVVTAQSLSILSLPESPRWLMCKGRGLEALQALRRVYSTDAAAESALAKLWVETAESKVDSLQRHGHPLPPRGAAAPATQDVGSGNPVVTGASKATSAAEDLDGLENWSAALMLAVFIGAFMHLSGGVAVRNYVGEIFSQGGLDPQLAGEFLVGLGFVKVGCTGGAISLVDTVGRRPLMLVGVMLMAAGMAVLAMAFADLGLGPVVTLTGCVGVISGYSLSYGPLAWLLWAEMFPTHVRGRMIGLASFCANGFMFLNNLVFEPLAATFGHQTIFTTYACLNMVAFWVFFTFLAETKGIAPLAVRDHLEARTRALCCCLYRCRPRAQPGPPRATSMSRTSPPRAAHGDDGTSSAHEDAPAGHATVGSASPRLRSIST